jgi:hypothetical protein
MDESEWIAKLALQEERNEERNKILEERDLERLAIQRSMIVLQREMVAEFKKAWRAEIAALTSIATSLKATKGGS